MNDSVSESNVAPAPDVDALLDEFDALLFRFARAVGSHAEGHEGAPPLSPPQYMVLRALQRSGSMRVSDVASHLGVTNPAASMLLQAMSEQGLVDREPDPTDGRATLLSLSPQGHTRVTEAEETRRRFMKRVTSRLSADDLRAMIRGLGELADAIAAESD